VLGTNSSEKTKDGFAAEKQKMAFQHQLFQII